MEYFENLEHLTNGWSYFETAMVSIPGIFCMFFTFYAYFLKYGTVEAAEPVVLGSMLQVRKILRHRDVQDMGVQNSELPSSSWLRKVIDVVLCIFSVGILLGGLYLTTYRGVIGLFVFHVALFISVIIVKHVFANIQELHIIPSIVLECLILVRYLTLYCLIYPELRMTALCCVILAGYCQEIKNFLVEATRENGPTENGKIEEERSENGRADDDRTENGRAEDERTENGRAEEERSENGRAEDERTVNGQIEEERSENGRAEDERTENGQIEEERSENGRAKDERTENGRVELSSVEETRKIDLRFTYGIQ